MSAPPDLIEAKAQELMKLEKEELARRLATVEILLDQINSDAKQWIFNIFKPFRGLKRDFTPLFGILVGLDLEIKAFHLWVDEKIKKYDTGEVVHEQKHVIVEAKNLIITEAIEWQEVLPPEQSQQQTM